MSVDAKSWVTLAQAKAYVEIGSTDSTRDALLELVIDGVSAALANFLGREVAKVTYTDAYLDGSGEQDLFLPHYPVISISSLAEDGVALTEGLTGDYLLYASKGILHKPADVWAPYPKNVKLTYVAGYTVQGATPGTGEVALPHDLKLACMMQVAAEWKRSQQKTFGASSLSVGGASISLQPELELLPQVKTILLRYRGTLAA